MSNAFGKQTFKAEAVILSANYWSLVDERTNTTRTGVKVRILDQNTEERQNFTGFEVKDVSFGHDISARIWDQLKDLQYPQYARIEAAKKIAGARGEKREGFDGYGVEPLGAIELPIPVASGAKRA